MTGLGRGAATFLWVLAGILAIAIHMGLGFVAANALSALGGRAEPQSGPPAMPAARIVLDTSPPPPPPEPKPEPERPAQPEVTLDSLMAEARRIDRPGIGLPTAAEAAAMAEASLAASAISLSTDSTPEPPQPAARAGLEAAVDILRRRATGACFVGFPRDSGAGDLDVRFFGAPEGGAAALTAEIETASGAPVALRTHPVTPRQCPALAFLRQAAAYPGAGLSLVLESVVISSGGALAGRITGQPEGAAVHVMLIDDAGLVQRLDGFLVPDPAGGMRFSIPLTLQGTPVTSAQLVLAVTAPAPLPSLATLTAAEAAGLFAALAQDFAGAGPEADFALAAFNLR